MPTALISLTAPKPLVQHFKGRHFVGGRCVDVLPMACGRLLSRRLTVGSFVAPSIAKKYGFDVPHYEGLDQIVEVNGTVERL